MASLADVLRWDPAAVEAAFTGFGTARDRLLDLNLNAAAPPARWLGATADAARTGHEQLTEQLRRVVAGVAAVRPTVADAADAIAALHADLARIDDAATTAGFDISAGADGTVTVTDTAPTVVAPQQMAAYRAQRSGAQTELSQALAAILHRADAIDATLADLLRRASAAQVDDGGATGSLAAADAVGARAAQLHITPPPAAGNPAAATAWWRQLTSAEQDRVLAEHPDWVGNLDGVPAAVRDTANRARLPAETARVDAELAGAQTELDAFDARPKPPSNTRFDTPEQRAYRAESARLDNRVTQFRGRRAALTTVASSIDHPDRHLLLLDVSGHEAPRAAVAVGNVDTADHVAVFTPGLATTVAGDLGSYADDLAGVRRTAQSELRRTGHGDQAVATVAWLGYDEPQWDTLAEPDRSVALPLDARHGGADLARFYDGLATSRADDPAHVTALGHSYGSTTTGYALQHITTPIQDAVLFGSPGAGTSDLADLHVPAGHFNVIEARGDPVADLGSFGGDPNHLAGVTNLSARDATAPDGTALHESTGHSQYLAPGTTSQYNIADTVAGLDDQRITDPNNSGFGDALRNAASRRMPF